MPVDLTLPMLILFGIALLVLLIVALACIAALNKFLRWIGFSVSEASIAYRDDVYTRIHDERKAREDEDSDDEEATLADEVDAALDHAYCRRREQLRHVHLPSDDKLIEELL